MRFKLAPYIPDDLLQAPPVVVEAHTLDDLIAYVEDELVNDDGMLIGPGTRLTIERID